MEICIVDKRGHGGWGNIQFHSFVLVRHTFNTKGGASTIEACNRNFDQTFSEEADDWSRPKGEGKVNSQHDGGKDNQAGAEVVLHLDHNNEINIQNIKNILI